MEDLIHILFQKSLMCSHIDATQSTSLLFGYKYQNIPNRFGHSIVMNIIRGGVADTSITQGTVTTSSCISEEVYYMEPYRRVVDSMWLDNMGYHKYFCTGLINTPAKTSCAKRKLD